MRLGGHESDEIRLVIDGSGTRLSAVCGGEKIEYEKLLALCCLNEMRNGRDIAVPYDAPAFLDLLAEENGRKAYRYLSTPADNSDSSARRLAAKQIFVRDGLFLAVKLLSVAKERDKSIARLLSELPEKYIVRKSVRIGFSPSNLAAVVGEGGAQTDNGFEGIKLVKSGGRLLVIPERSGERVRVLAEADSMEAADELCADIEEKLNSASQI